MSVLFCTLGFILCVPGLLYKFGRAQVICSFLSVDAEQDEADGGQLRGRPSEGGISELRAAKQSQALARSGKMAAQS